MNQSNFQFESESKFLSAAMSIGVSLWRRGRRRCGLPGLLLGCALASLMVYDTLNGQHPLTTLTRLVRGPGMGASRSNAARPWELEEPGEAAGQGEVGRPIHPNDVSPEQQDEPRAVETPKQSAFEHRRGLAHPGADVGHLRGGATDPTALAEVQLYEGPMCTGSELVFTASRTEHKCSRCFDACRATFPSGTAALNKIMSFRVKYNGQSEMPAGWSVSVYDVCGGTFAYSDADMRKARFHSGLRPESGCITIDNGHYPNMFRFDGMPDPDSMYEAQSYHVTYSCESSTYFAFQAYANLYAFEHSGQQQTPKPGYTRLLTSSVEDDLSIANGGKIPTFTSPREPFSRTYSPYNKPTSLAAFMEGPQSPSEEVIILIDPDNWIVRDLGPIAAKVREGHAVATAAFYDGNPLVTDLYKNHICENACDFIPDTVAVPYFIHREDARKIAPLWKRMTKKVWDVFQNREHATKYNSLQPGWCAEMYGYVFAAAELRVKHTILPNLQHRDVDGKLTWEEADKRRIRMIHMGRAWFNEEWAHKNAARWIHRPKWEWSPPGTEQVWCKCNDTAADERPWPMPPDVDFVSNVTLTLLHESLLMYGNAPRNQYRRGYAGTHD